MNRPLPSYLGIEATRICNVHPPCVMCPKHGGERPEDVRDFPNELLIKLHEPLAACDELGLTGLGEPLATNRVFELADLVKPTSKVSFNTNAVLLRDRRLDMVLARPQIKLLNISMDAASPELFHKIRFCDFDTVVNNIKTLLQRRGPELRVMINFCVMKENLHELVAFVELGHRLGVDDVLITHLAPGLGAWKLDWFDYAQQNTMLDPELHDKVFDAAFDRAAALGVRMSLGGPRRLVAGPLSIPDVVPAAAAKWTCSIPTTHAFINIDGAVRFCCYQAGQVGSLVNNTFVDIWNGRAMMAVVESTAAGVPHQMCADGLPCPALPAKRS